MGMQEPTAISGLCLGCKGEQFPFPIMKVKKQTISVWSVVDVCEKNIYQHKET